MEQKLRLSPYHVINVSPFLKQPLQFLSERRTLWRIPTCGNSVLQNYNFEMVAFNTARFLLTRLSQTVFLKYQKILKNVCDLQIIYKQPES